MNYTSISAKPGFDYKLSAYTSDADAMQEARDIMIERGTCTLNGIRFKPLTFFKDGVVAKMYQMAFYSAVVTFVGCDVTAAHAIATQLLNDVVIETLQKNYEQIVEDFISAVENRDVEKAKMLSEKLYAIECMPPKIEFKVCVDGNTGKNVVSHIEVVN